MKIKFFQKDIAVVFGTENDVQHLVDETPWRPPSDGRVTVRYIRYDPVQGDFLENIVYKGPPHRDGDWTVYGPLKANFKRGLFILSDVEMYLVLCKDGFVSGFGNEMQAVFSSMTCQSVKKSEVEVEK